MARPHAVGTRKSHLQFLPFRLYGHEGLVADLREIAHGGAPFLSSNGFADKAFRDQLLSRPQFSRFTIVYHGRLGRFYDKETLCEVIEILEETNPEIRFLMIGELSAFRARKPWKPLSLWTRCPLRNWLRSWLVAMLEFVCSRKRMP